MSLGMGEIAFIALLALLVVGPKKLPEIAKQVGKAFAEVKRASAGFTEQVNGELQQMNIGTQAEQGPAEICNPDLAIATMLLNNCSKSERVATNNNELTRESESTSVPTQQPAA